MNISYRDIKRELGSTSYQRGLAYFNANKVLSLELEVDTEQFAAMHAVVSGSKQAIYEVSVTLDNEGDLFTRSNLLVEGICSCPVGFNCKHVAAVCLRFLASTNRFNEPVRFEWLEGIARAETKLDPDALNQLHFLIFYLRASAAAGVLDLEVKESYYKRNNDLAKPKGVRSSTLMYGSHVKDYPDHDQQTLQLMRALTSGYSQGCKIRDELGALLLKRIVATGHCYWQSLGGQPFSMGPILTMKLDWEKRADGSIRLRPLLSASSATLLLTDPVLYIDIPRRLIGEANHSGFNLKQLKAIVNAPEVKPAAIDELSRKLAISYPELKIPKPIPVKIIQIPAKSLVPRLTLLKKQLDYRYFHALKLQFKYADMTVEMLPRETVTSMTRGQDIYQIQRDLSLELEKNNILVDFGFELVNEDQHPFFFSAANSIIESATRWHHFMETEIPKLKTAGWEIITDPSFSLSFEMADDWFAGLEKSDNDWFELRFDLELHGKKWPMVPLISQILQAYPIPEIPDTLAVPLSESEYVLLTWEQIEPVIETLYELFDYEPNRSVFKISKYDAKRLASLEKDHEQLQIKGAGKLLELGRKLQDFTGITHLQAPRGLQTSLRPYQHSGFEWLQFLREYELNGILADDMGLGKTVQVLAHLLYEQEQGRLQLPSLIIAPTTLMSNWRREVERFAPSLRVLTLQGSQRRELFGMIPEYDIILSTYPLLSRDAAQLLPHKWYTVVLDEAQMVKNPKAQASKIIRQLHAEHRLCLTGTPMENHLGELWSLFDFLMPGFLASEKRFNAHFRTPIEKNADHWIGKQLARRVKPFLLRRTKDEVLQELPPKSELIRSVAMDEAQSKLYESIRISMEKRVRDAIAKNGLSRSHITILDALLKLRQVCCDPRLVKLTQAQKVKQSAKLELLMTMLPEMLEEGRKVLLFSQFTSMLALIEPELVKQGIKYSKLTGRTREREAVIDEFKSGTTDLFLISLKAGGLGLNLTEADTVIIYDPWWNPAVEAQAADRTHRIGQDKSVFIYKLIVENSVEEKILALQEQKQLLAKGIYGDGESSTDALFTAEDISSLFEPLRPEEASPGGRSQPSGKPWNQ